MEAEILCLDRKIEELKLKLYYEQRQTQERTLARQSHVRQSSLPLRHDLHQRSLTHCYQRSTLDTVSTTHSRLSFSYAPDFLDATSSGGFTGKLFLISNLLLKMHNSTREGHQKYTCLKTINKNECSNFTHGHGFGGQIDMMEYQGCRMAE